MIAAPRRSGSAKPSGPVAAALLATGIGSLVLAVLVILAEARQGFAESLAYDDDIGPLSGESLWTSVAFLGSWGVLTVLLRGRDVGLGKIIALTAVLVALAVIGTFPPFFELFAPAE